MSYIAQAAIDFYEAMIAKGFQDWDSDDCCRFCDCRERGAHTADCPFGKFAVAVKNAHGEVGRAGELTGHIHGRLDAFERGAKSHVYHKDVLQLVNAIRPIADELALAAAELREEMKGMVDASWKDACLGWQRDICAAVGLAPVEKSVLLAALRDRHASAERVRKIVEHAKTKRPCAEHYTLLLKDLLEALPPNA